METPSPYIEPPRQGPRINVLRINLATPFTWLKAGLSDLRRAPGIAIFYGVCFWIMAVTLATVFKNKPEYAMSIASGCLLVGPFLAMGLYDVSRRLELGLPVRLTASLTCWRPHIKSMGMLLLVLMVLELLWGRASLVVFAVFFNTGMPSTSGVIQAIFNQENMDFLIAYVMVGGVFAALVYAISVVSIPFIYDKDVDAITAGISSIRVVTNNSLPLLLWGMLITALVTIALVPWGLGILVIGPLLGHASWHAYRGTVHWEPDAIRQK